MKTAFTYFGGASDQDRAKAVAVGPHDHVYIVGALGGLDPGFISTLPATIDVPRYEGKVDGFIAVFSSDLRYLKWFNLIGGEFSDIALGIAIAPNGDFYVCGSTTSYPLEYRGLQVWTKTRHCVGCGSRENNGSGFIARYNSNGRLLAWRYVEDPQGEYTWAQGIAVGNGCVYVTGARKNPKGPQNFDAFLACYSLSLGAQRTFKSIGGPEDENPNLPADTPRGIAVDAKGNVFISGESMSTDVDISPSPTNALPGTHFPGPFVYEQDQAGQVILFTSLADSGGGDAKGLRINSDRTIFVSGRVMKNKLVEKNGFKTIDSGMAGTVPEHPTFAAEIQTKPKLDLIFSTYLSGFCPGKQDGTGLAIDNSDHLYLVGYTPCSNFPPPPSTGFGNGAEVFLSRIHYH